METSMSEFALVLSWPVVAGLSVVLLISVYVLGRRRASSAGRSMADLADQIRAMGMTADASTFAVGDERHVLVVTATDVVIVDRVRRKVAQHFSHREVLGLKMTEGGTRVDFALLLNGGAESRTVRTHSAIEFARLFELFTRQDKHLEFIPEYGS
jgi:hypothetical protein